MKKQIKSLLLVTLLAGSILPLWGQATPSTEGKDFWVTFLRADDDNPERLKLTISALKACVVTIENTNTGLNQRLNVAANSSTELLMNQGDCYSSTNEQATYTALHVTSTEDISLFAGNYRSKSFDAANILPTTALLDDYLIQTYPPSDHEGNPQGSHFAIVAVEDGTIVDYNLTAKTNSGTTGMQATPTLNKGQVWYVWTGKGAGDNYDLSGTTVKARNGKKIAVFQGCPHTNVPDKVRNRDHIFSQAMPTAYWGSEFGITSSLMRRRDIIAVMAINDGTEVYINNEDGDPILVHTFDFNVDKKHYWTFEIGEELAYCHSSESSYDGQLPLPPPLIVDSSCYITSSCPVGVHLIMPSNRYDLPTYNTPEPDSDPALLWISPIEQVIKDINFATYNEGINTHYVNIVTTTADISSMLWTDKTGATHNLQSYFHPIYGNPDYSYARIRIEPGSHRLKGNVGFLAHVYGYGDKASYAYSCGSSTIQRSVTFNGSPLMIDSVYHGKFCTNEPIEMKLNIGNNDYERIEWDFGDGITYAASPSASNQEKKQTTHLYSAPGWYDLTVSAVYVNHCTNQRYDEDMHFSFRVVRPDTIFGKIDHNCIKMDSTLDGVKLSADEVNELLTNGKVVYIPGEQCYDTVKMDYVHYGIETEETLEPITGKDSARGHNGKVYDRSTDVTDTVDVEGCKHYQHYHVEVQTCLDLSFPNDGEKPSICPGEELPVHYALSKGSIKAIDPAGYNAILRVKGYPDQLFTIPNRIEDNGDINLPTKDITRPGHYTAQVVVEDEYCEQTDSVAVAFTVHYPNNIFKYKFNNVMAVYKPGYGGNVDYEFANYEWHLIRNGQDSILAAGPNASVLHLDEGTTFEINDIVYVVLTDLSGTIGALSSCEFIVKETPQYGNDANQAPAPAVKQLINRSIVITKGEQSYNIYGQRVNSEIKR